jgi:hypothetical protein
MNMLLAITSFGPSLPQSEQSCTNRNILSISGSCDGSPVTRKSSGHLADVPILNVADDIGETVAFFCATGDGVDEALATSVPLPILSSNSDSESDSVYKTKGEKQ